MEKINGEWYMSCCEKSDPNLLKTADDLLVLLRVIGFLPLFAGGITGFSVEERTLVSSWWSGDIQSDPWEWRIALAGHPEVAYGKFFDKKAGFIHKDFFPIFANYRRNGYDFDSLVDEGLAKHRAGKIMDVFELNEEAVGKEIMSNELKEKAGFGKDGGEKNFEGILTELQMQTYLIVSDFRQRTNKKGEPFGWHIAAMGTPETKWGYDFITSQYNEEPSASWERINEQVHRFFPDAEEGQIQKILGIKYPGTDASPVKPQKKAVRNPSIPLWPENLLKEIGNVPLTLNEDQMAGLQYAISTLQKREQNVIRQYFEKSLTHKEIGEKAGVSTTRIGQLKMKALRKMRHHTRSDLIRYGLHGRNPKTNESVAAHAMSPLLQSILTKAGLQTMEQIETLIRDDPEKLLQLRGLGEKTRAELLFTLDVAGIDTSAVKELMGIRFKRN